MTDEEIRALVSGSTTLGDEERQIVDDVFDAGSRSLREVMLPRTEVDFLPGDMPAHKAVREVLKAPHSPYPVMGESADDIIGFVHVRDLLDPEVSSRTTPVSEVARPVISLPDTVRVLRALTRDAADGQSPRDRARRVRRDRGHRHDGGPRRGARRRHHRRVRRGRPKSAPPIAATR